MKTYIWLETHTASRWAYAVEAVAVLLVIATLVNMGMRG